MKAEGTDTSTTFIDDSSYNHTLTAVNNVQIDTAQYKFGSSSALFDGSGDYISAPDHAGWDLSDANSDQFTVEAWIRPAAGGGTIAGQDSGDGAMSWLFGLSGTNLNFQWTHTGGYFDSSLQSRSSFPNSLSLSAWHHVAVDKDATGKIRLYIDGATVNAVSAPANSAIFNASAILKIGSSPNLGDFNGHIDELRITKGIARYAADSSYTIPTETFPQAGTPSTTADSTSIKADTTSYTADKS
jgi:hypothetical protein